MKRLRYFILTASLVATLAVGFFGVSAFAQGGTAVVKSVPSQSLSDTVVNRAKTSWPWYVVRASGLIAGASLIILLLSGIGSVTGHTFRFLEPLTAWATHRALGIVFVVSVVIHMAGLLFDKFVSFNIVSLLVPWVSDYKPLQLFGVNLGSLYVAMGVLAFYGALAILFTSLFWVDKKPKIWKFLHLMSYAVMALVFVHALFLGTDTGDGLVRLGWIAGAILVIVAIVARLRRVGATK